MSIFKHNQKELSNPISFDSELSKQDLKERARSVSKTHAELAAYEADKRAAEAQATPEGGVQIHATPVTEELGESAVAQHVEVPQEPVDPSKHASV